MTGGADGDSAALARRLLEPGAALPPALADARALAWALKDLGHAAFGRAPAQAGRAAEVLRALADATPADPEIEALARWSAAIACLTRGQMAEAVAALDAAAAGLRACGRPDPAAQTQVAKIMALSMLGRHDEAIACAEAAQRELSALGNLGAAARVSQNLGGLLLRRDAYAESAHHHRVAAAMFERLADPERAAHADIGLADALTSMGDFDEARRIYARARSRAQAHGLEQAGALIDESEALLDLARGRYREALAGFESARRRYAALAVPQYLAIAEKQLADAYLELRLLPEALTLFDAAVGQFTALDLPDEQAWALAQRGRTQALLGLDEADASFAAAAALFAAQDNAVGAAAIELARADIALARGDAEAAAAGAGRAAAGFAAADQADGRARSEVMLGQAWLDGGRPALAAERFAATLAEARERAQLQVQVRCLTGLGRCALADGDAALATERFEAAIALFEEQRRALPGDEIRSAFLTDHLRPYEERVRLALGGGDGAEVLRQLERYRARSLDERLAEGGGAEADDAGARALRERLNWLYRRVQRRQDEAGPHAALADEMRRTEHALLERARRQRLAAPAGPAAAAGFDIAALPAALAPGDALVEYGLLDGALFACVVTAQGVRLLPQLADAAQAGDAIDALRFQLDALRHGAAPVQRHLDALTARAHLRLARVRALVWEPLAPALAGCRRVMVVPHGPLGLVPFGAVADDPALELAMVPSARAALRGLARRPVVPRRVLALGESSRLARTAHEARFVATLFPQGRACVGEAATRAALRAHAAEADVLHLACHAQFRQDNPRFSMLHLQDGALSADEAETLPLGPGTVVLSACETGVAELGRGDEMVGLVRAFLVAGAARVVASQWPVDDAATEGFMAAFYGALVRGRSAAAALRDAQVATRATHRHPAFWAAFTLWGGW